MDHVIMAKDVLSGKTAVSDPVVIIGGGEVGLEVAEYLAEKGRRVTVIEALDELARGLPEIVKLPLLIRLEELDVAIRTKATVKEIQKEAVIIQWKGLETKVNANTVILAVGYESNQQLFDRVKGRVSEAYLIGDSVKPRRLLEAIQEGFEIGIKI